MTEGNYWVKLYENDWTIMYYRGGNVCWCWGAYTFTKNDKRIQRIDKHRIIRTTRKMKLERILK